MEDLNFLKKICKRERALKSFIIKVRYGEFHVILVPLDFNECFFQQNQNHGHYNEENPRMILDFQTDFVQFSKEVSHKVVVYGQRSQNRYACVILELFYEAIKGDQVKECYKLTDEFNFVLKNYFF